MAFVDVIVSEEGIVYRIGKKTHLLLRDQSV